MAGRPGHFGPIDSVATKGWCKMHRPSCRTGRRPRLPCLDESEALPCQTADYAAASNCFKKTNKRQVEKICHRSKRNRSIIRWGPLMPLLRLLPLLRTPQRQHRIGNHRKADARLAVLAIGLGPQCTLHRNRVAVIEPQQLSLRGV